MESKKIIIDGVESTEYILENLKNNPKIKIEKIEEDIYKTKQLLYS